MNFYLFFFFSPIYALGSCIRDHISFYTNYNEYCDVEEIVGSFFNNDTLRQTLLSSLQSDMSTSTNTTESELKFVDALSRYSKDKCPS